MSRRRRTTCYRRLRLERSEDRCLLSAAPLLVGDLGGGDLRWDDAAAYLPSPSSGWVTIDTDSRLPSFNFSGGGADDVGAQGTLDSLSNYPTTPGPTTPGLTTLGSFDFTAESFRDEAASLQLSLGYSASATGGTGVTFSWPSDQQGWDIAPVLRAEFTERGLVVNAAFFDAVITGTSDQLYGVREVSAPLADLLQLWLSESTSYFSNQAPNTDGWIGELAGTGSSEQGASTNGDLGSWADSEASTGPATPSLENALTRGDDGYGDNPATIFRQVDDADDGSHVLSKLREWIRNGSTPADGESLAASSLRSRPSVVPLQRVTESPAPPAGEESPGAGMIDLSALLLAPSGGDEAPSVLLAAARQPSDEAIPVSARDTALAVESWVRTLPVPAEAVGVVEVVAPPTDGPAVEVRTDAPSRKAAPQPQAAEDHVSKAAGASSGVPALAKGLQSPAERIDEKRADDAPGYVAAWLTTLLGGAMVWVNRRGGRNRTSDCIETPLGKHRGTPQNASLPGVKSGRGRVK